MECIRSVNEAKSAIDGISMLFTGFIIGYLFKSLAEMLDLVKQHLRMKLHT